jgi:ribosomal protein L11 methyltransferase
MSWLQLRLDIGEQNPSPFEETLLELGAVSVTLEDAGDEPVLEPLPGETPLWRTVVIKALFPGDSDSVALRSLLRQAISDAPEAEIEWLEDRQWEREWLKDFKPMQFGRRLWVCPNGMPAGDPRAIRIELDPGMAFGTGTHATTAMCLAWLETCDISGRKMIDYGCGSGILAIAALKLGAASAIAMDIDPQALIATRENAVRNDVSVALVVTDRPLLDGRTADVLVANILAGPLRELAPAFAAMLPPGAQIALSGLLIEQAESVTACYRKCFYIQSTITQGDWCLLSGRRHPDR